jgi:hypothetical protein
MAKSFRRISKDWPHFAHNLAASLEVLDEDEYLILISKVNGRFIQFVCQGSFGMRAEAVSNNYLTGECRLSEDDHARLLRLGWSPPTHSAREENNPDQRDPDGSPNYFCEWDRPVPFALVAQMAVDTLRDVYGVTHPGTLMYKAASTSGTKVRMPQLGLREEPAPSPPKLPKIEVEINLDTTTLRDEILHTLQVEFGEQSAVIDDDNDVALRWHDAVLFLRIVDDPRHIKLFSPLLDGVRETDMLYREVNDRNADLTAGKVFLINQSLIFAMELFAEPYVPDFLMRTLVFALMVASHLAKELRPVFGGRPFVGRSDEGTVSPRWRESGNGD